jgi:hypothetical protein
VEDCGGAGVAVVVRPEFVLLRLRALSCWASSVKAASSKSPVTLD